MEQATKCMKASYQVHESTYMTDMRFLFLFMEMSSDMQICAPSLRIADRANCDILVGVVIKGISWCKYTWNIYEGVLMNANNITGEPDIEQRYSTIQLCSHNAVIY